MHSPNTLRRLLKNQASQPADYALPFPLLPAPAHESVLAHSIPPNAVPIIENGKASDYFTDLTTDLDDRRLVRQVKGIVSKFPPPFPPFVRDEGSGSDSDESFSEGDVEELERKYEELLSDSNDEIEIKESGGVMVPFIYPPPPVIDMDKMPLRRKRPEEEGSKKRLLAYLEVPPLPFPPAHFMPYPLEAHKSAPVPEDAFAALIKANEKLPKVDMVLASAAGSLFDIGSQARDEGFEVSKFEREKEEGKEENDDKRYQEYMEYLSGIRRDEKIDPYDKRRKKRRVAQYTHNVRVKMRESSERENDENERESGTPFSVNRESNTSVEKKPIKERSHFVFPEISDIEIIQASGAQKEKRRAELCRTLSRLEAQEQKQRRSVYESRKRVLLERLRRLRESKIGFEQCDIHDPELQAYQTTAETVRDEELVRLKIKANHELLQNSMLFYYDSNRNYKQMLSSITNKLDKLKNFLEYQKGLFEGHLSQKNSSLFEIHSRESAALVKAVTLRSPSPDEEAPSHIGLVHDYMPMVSEAELAAISGDLPSKIAQSKDVKKHKIFQSPLYERTSGSESNASEGTASGPGRPPLLKRGRGRRPAADRPDHKYSEAALLAKIMKQFQGPQEASGEEMGRDLEMMGVSSKFT